MSELKRGVYPPPLKDPHSNDTTQPFWDYTLKGKLAASKCKKCGTFLLPPQPRCFVCQNDKFDWVELPGTGTVYTYTVVRHPLRPGLEQVVPYAAGMIELDGTQGAGARIQANIINCDVEKVRIGDRVKVVFERISDTYVVPRFEPA